MLTYSLEKTGSDSLYRQLYNCLKTDILSHKLGADEKLPSKRSLAANLGISIITVETAYQQLVAEGYIYSLPKKGFFVAKITDFICQEVLQLYVKPNVLKTEAEIKYDKGNAAEHSAEIIDFTNNKVIAENFPFSVWAKLAREQLNENQQALLNPSPVNGIWELRYAIAKHLSDFRDIRVSPEQIVVGAGAEYLYGFLIQLLGFDKRYGVENPGYSKISKIYGSHKVKMDYISMDNSGVLIDELEKAKTDVLHISPSHHFPTGIVTPVSRRYELLGWAAKQRGRYIIEDDYDSEFRMTGRPIPALLNIDASENVIYMNTFSKTLASTVRVSYMILPPHLLQDFHEKLGFYSCTVPNLTQYTLARFISEGYYEKHINRMRNFYHNKRDMILSAIKNSKLSKRIRIKEQDAGLHFIVELDTRECDENIKRQLWENNIRIAALSQFYHDNANGGEHSFVVNYSSITESEIDTALKVLEKILK